MEFARPFSVGIRICPGSHRYGPDLQRVLAQSYTSAARSINWSDFTRCAPVLRDLLLMSAQDSAFPHIARVFDPSSSRGTFHGRVDGGSDLPLAGGLGGETV